MSLKKIKRKGNFNFDNFVKENCTFIKKKLFLPKIQKFAFFLLYTKNL